MIMGLLGNKLMWVMVAIILIMAGSGWVYFRYSQNQIAELNQQTAVLRQAVTQQQQVIAAQEQAAIRQNEQIQQLQHSVGAAESRRRELEARLRRMDLQARARANSQDLENRINRATIQAFRDIETMTVPQTGASAQTTPTSRTPTSPTPAARVPHPAPRPPVSNRSGS